MYASCPQEAGHNLIWATRRSQQCWNGQDTCANEKLKASASKAKASSPCWVAVIKSSVYPLAVVGRARWRQQIWKSNLGFELWSHARCKCVGCGYSLSRFSAVENLQRAIASSCGWTCSQGANSSGDVSWAALTASQDLKSAARRSLNVHALFWVLFWRKFSFTSPISWQLQVLGIRWLEFNNYFGMLGGPHPPQWYQRGSVFCGSCNAGYDSCDICTWYLGRENCMDCSLCARFWGKNVTWQIIEKLQNLVLIT